MRSFVPSACPSATKMSPFLPTTTSEGELNVFVPMIARNVIQSTKLLASASRLLAEKCVDGITANREVCRGYAELTLSAAAALNPYTGYDLATEIVKEAAASKRSLREVARDKGVDEDVLDKALDYAKMTEGGLL